MATDAFGIGWPCCHQTECEGGLCLELRELMLFEKEGGALALEFGMPTLIENKTIENNIALCKELGLSFIELNMNFPEYQIDKIEDIDCFYNKADEAGIYYTIHLDENLNVAEFNPLVRSAYLETVRRTIEVAKHFVELKNKYGKKDQSLIINMHMHHGIYITLPDKKVQMYERDFDVYMDYFFRFIKLCEEWIGDADIQIAIENTDGFREYEKRAIESMLKSDCFVLTWDIGHSKGTGEIDVPFILDNRSKLSHFHIHDGRENPTKNHLALGDGEIDLIDRLNMARTCNARCVLETKTIAALKKSVEWKKMMEIKRAVVGEAGLVAKLAIQMWDDHSVDELEAEFVNYMNNGGAVFIIWNDNDAIGFAQCGFRHDYVEGTETSPVGYLEGVFVEEAYRRQGIARELVRACQMFAKEQGCIEFASDCELDNEESLQFHLKMGFEEANRIICFTKKL